MSARSYRGKVVVVTGGGAGLGRALAECFAREGACVAVLDLDGSAAESCAAGLRDLGVPALGLACDVASEPACRTAIGQVAAHFAGIDVLVANAGISARCLLADTRPEVIRRVMDVNFFGAANATQAALPWLRQRRGQVIVISSVAGFSPLVGRTAYAASKHALHGFFDSLRTEVARDGVGVMLACPSFIATGIERAALDGDGQPTARARATAGAPATPEDVARRIVADARRGQRLCLPSATSVLAWWTQRLAPRLYERLMLARTGAEFDLAARDRP